MDLFTSLENKTAFITGSTSGIGKAIASALVSAGCKVWVHGKEASVCECVCWEIKAAGWFAVDLFESNAGSVLAAQLKEKIEVLHILINNAGIEAFNPFEEFDQALFDRIYQVNTRSAVALTHGLLPLLKQAGGSVIINVTSIHQSIPYPKNLAYGMSKAALSMFTQTLALELAPYNIRVNNFAPGAVRTEINKEVIDRLEDKFREWIPMNRVAETEDMIGGILFLCSDSSAYTTGTTLFADGGYRLSIIRY